MGVAVVGCLLTTIGWLPTVIATDSTANPGQTPVWVSIAVLILFTAIP
jgi:hypothetical protein